ncbi:hypothetical protein LNP25_16245 [Klebsiella variicola subsp. variicola]|nr:hypothetical protein [Klebsiella variicola subsp. variicola]
MLSIKTALAALKEDKPTAKGTPYQAMPADAQTITAQAKRALTGVPGGGFALTRPTFPILLLPLGEGNKEK